MGGASLSIFEGLRLSRVSVTVPGPEAVDSTLFVVDSLDISYDPAALLRGKLDATRLIATGTHVFLVEDLGDGSWNYKRLKRSALKPRGKKSPSATEEPLILPEIVLRNASVEYSELRNGKYTSRGLLGLDGRLSPAGEQDQYLFELQSRGLSERVGPVLAGEVTLTTGRVSASLKNLSFGPDLLAMLPSEVRQLWQAHHLQGGLDIPVFNYTPATDKSKANFLLRTEFKDVRLVVRPQELGSHAVAERLDALERSIDQVRAAGFVFDPLADRLTTAAVPPDVAVQNVTGTFQFDPAGMSFDAVGGSFEGIPIVMSGKANGYAPDVPFHLHAQSPADRVIQLQPQLKYLSALPPVARKIYTMIQPSGYCTFGGDIDRLSAGAKPRVTGSLQILDGAARCIFFPYPVRHITGRLLLTADPVTGDQTLRLDRLRGVGPAESPNADTHVLVDGVVGPFDKRLGCDVNVTSDHVVSDPVLVAAFPPDVRDALSAFRSLPDGQTPPRPYPDFSGAFACHVTMPIAVGSKVTVALELHVADASGTVVAFPYPFRHAAGELHIRDGRLDVEHLGETAGNARVSFDGAVTWPTQLHPNVPAASVLVVHGRSIPIDPTLIGALPPDKAEAMKRLGIGGTLDIDGTINTDPPTAANAAAPAMDRLRFALDLGLHDAWLKTPDGRSEADRVNGIVHLTPDGASTKELHGRRGPAELSGTGSIDWTGAEPVVHMSVAAKGLLLDGPLRALLPVEAQSAWDAVTPSGAVDAEFAFDRKNAKPDYTLTLHPDHARVSPTFLPYAMTGCTGAITVTPDRTTLTDFEGDHGPARVKISGVGVERAGDGVGPDAEREQRERRRRTPPRPAGGRHRLARRRRPARQGVDRPHQAELPRHRRHVRRRPGRHREKSKSDDGPGDPCRRRRRRAGVRLGHPGRKARDSARQAGRGFAGHGRPVDPGPGGRSDQAGRLARAAGRSPAGPPRRRRVRRASRSSFSRRRADALLAELRAAQRRRPRHRPGQRRRTGLAVGQRGAGRQRRPARHPPRPRRRAGRRPAHVPDPADARPAAGDRPCPAQQQPLQRSHRPLQRQRRAHQLRPDPDAQQRDADERRGLHGLRLEEGADELHHRQRKPATDPAAARTVAGREAGAATDPGPRQRSKPPR